MAGNYRTAEEEIRKAIENHMIVAALIATVTFAAGFTLPGGYVQSGSSSNEGMALLSLPDNSTAIKHWHFFKYFVVADGTAMGLSMCAVGIYFLAALPTERKDALMASLIYGYCLTIFAMVATVIAFVSGLLAVLPRSSMAGNAIKFIVLPAFLLLFFLQGGFIMLERTRDGEAPTPPPPPPLTPTPPPAPTPTPTPAPAPSLSPPTKPEPELEPEIALLDLFLFFSMIR